MLRDPLAMGRQKGLRRCTGVITGAIVDQKQMLRGLRQDRLEERLVTFRIKPTLDALREETPREIFNGSKDFVAFALATGGNLRLLATTRPRVTQGAPLRKTGLIFKQNQPLAPLGRSDNRRPLLLQPGEALRCIEMIRHKPSLLKRKPQVAE